MHIYSSHSRLTSRKQQPIVDVFYDPQMRAFATNGKNVAIYQSKSAMTDMVNMPLIRAPEKVNLCSFFFPLEAYILALSPVRNALECVSDNCYNVCFYSAKQNLDLGLSRYSGKTNIAEHDSFSLVDLVQ